MKVSTNGKIAVVLLDADDYKAIKNSSYYQNGVINMEYERLQADDDSGIWRSRSNSNSRYTPILEELYQKLINKPVETTNEIPNRKCFLQELKEYNETGRTCFCGHSKFCDC